MMRMILLAVVSLMLILPGTSSYEVIEPPTKVCRCVWYNANELYEGASEICYPPPSALNDRGECFAAFGNVDMIERLCGGVYTENDCNDVITWMPGHY